MSHVTVFFFSDNVLKLVGGGYVINGLPRLVYSVLLNKTMFGVFNFLHQKQMSIMKNPDIRLS